MGIKMKRFFVVLLGFMSSSVFAAPYVVQADKWIFVQSPSHVLQSVPGRTVLAMQAQQAGCYQPSIDAYCTEASVCSHPSDQEPFISIETPAEYAHHIDKGVNVFYLGSGTSAPGYAYKAILGFLTTKLGATEATIIARQGIKKLGIRDINEAPSIAQQVQVFYSNPTGYQTTTIPLPLIPVIPTGSATCAS